MSAIDTLKLVLCLISVLANACVIAWLAILPHFMAITTPANALVWMLAATCIGAIASNIPRSQKEQTP